ncbi:MAG: hypothetical protein QM758_22670 [Armatimonas sp.]
MSEQVQSYEYRFLTEPIRIKGRLSTFREGNITLNQNGFSIVGRAVLPPAQQWGIALCGLLLFGVGLVLAAILVDTVIRVNKTEFYLWDNLEEVVVDHKRNRAGLVYHDPGKPRKISGLTMQLSQDSLEHFISAVNYYQPGKIREARLEGFSPTRILIALGIVFALIAAFAVVGILSSRH